MNNKAKNFLITFILMMIFDLGYYFIVSAPNFGRELTPHLGILFIGGLFFGPYGSLGAVIANLICDIVRGYTITSTIASAFISFIISYMAYKLWYTKDSEKHILTRPRLNSTYNMIYLLVVLFECGLLYSTLSVNLIEMFYPIDLGLNYHIGLQYFVNFINFGLVFSLALILISEKKDFTYTPLPSKKKYERLNFKIIYYLLVSFTVINIIFEVFGDNYNVNIALTIIVMFLLTLYNIKPINKITTIKYQSIPEKIMNFFVVITLIVLVVEIVVIFSPIRDVLSELLHFIATNQQYLIMLLIIDLIILLFFIPALILLNHIEEKVIDPINSFSKIEPYITKDKKIESDSILEIYSDYTTQDDEIGILSRSYTNLINYNNDYIENLESLEAEKHRINAELNIAHNIQLATLPKETLDNDFIKVKGYCKAAKEVGGDFYDFYKIDDENTMITIGDASGKGVPAAIFSMIIQNSIKLLIKNELDPARVLNNVNNQICENNTENMFITLFLAIYNNKTHKLTYANAGHNPPIVKNGDSYKLRDIDSEIVLGVWDDYEYRKHEIVLEDELLLYTDGITDAQNVEHELYGEERLINYLNTHKCDDIINNIIDEINTFSKDEEQFDDMTLLVLKVK
ncbi:MAG: hypothetical protein BZ136_02755 [Methanosphaera sp. rholeuAM74]|nr:MAG: hypothetical protein BZ136_02755 [Methanosphaera sp. rholeuAM74]